MPLAYAVIDWLENLSQVERFGSVRALTRMVHIIVVPGNNPQDYSVLQLALDICPLPFSTAGSFPIGVLNPPNYVSNYSSLVLVERSAAISDKDPNHVNVTLKYEHILDGPNQQYLSIPTATQINPPSPINLYGKGKTSIVEKKTNFYYPNGVNTTKDANGFPVVANRVQILVGHVFSASDTGAIPQCVGFYNQNFKGQNNEVVGNYGLNASVQGGEVSIPFPQSNYSVSGIVSGVADPFSINNAIVGYINSLPWLEKPAFTWICSEARFEVIDINNGEYRYDFEFQYNIDTWNPTAVFIDQRTGFPPANAVKGAVADPTITNLPLPVPPILSYQTNPFGTFTGGSALLPADFWTVPALPQLDFNAFFQQMFS